MNAKLNRAVAACSLALSLVLMSGAQTQDKESAVVLKCRGSVIFQPVTGRPSKVSTLKTFAGQGSFVVQPDSEMTFYDFRTASRVTVKVPAGSKEVKLDVGSGAIVAKQPTVTVQASQQLAALGPESFKFRESMGAASSKTPTNSQRLRLRGTPTPSGGGNNGAPAPAPAPSETQMTDSVKSDFQKRPNQTETSARPELCLFTISENPSLPITEDEYNLLGSGDFYRREHSTGSKEAWTLCKGLDLGAPNARKIALNQKFRPGQAIEYVRAPHSPTTYTDGRLLIARYPQATIDSLTRQKASAATLDARLEYLAGLASLRLFAEADLELKSLAKDFPKGYDWEQVRRDIFHH
jgi:hypothetical protein